jgi:hypothetical protein
MSNSTSRDYDSVPSLEECISTEEGEEEEEEEESNTLSELQSTTELSDNSINLSQPKPKTPNSRDSSPPPFLVTKKSKTESVSPLMSPDICIRLKQIESM